MSTRCTLPPASIYHHALAVGFSRGFAVAAGIALLALLIACAASLAWGLHRREFAFVAYAAVYGYIGVSSLLIRNLAGDTVLAYFTFTAIGMIVMLVLIARHFGRHE